MPGKARFVINFGRIIDVMMIVLAVPKKGNAKKLNKRFNDRCNHRFYQKTTSTFLYRFLLLKYFNRLFSPLFFRVK